MTDISKHRPDVGEYVRVNGTGYIIIGVHERYTTIPASNHRGRMVKGITLELVTTADFDEVQNG